MRNKHNISVTYLRQLLPNVNKPEAIKFLNYQIVKGGSDSFVGMSDKEKKVLESIQKTGQIPDEY